MVVLVILFHDAFIKYNASNTSIDLAEPMFVKMFFRIKSLCWNLKFCITPWSRGWQTEVVFGGKKIVFIFFRFKSRGWDPALSKNKRIFLFWLPIFLSSFISHFAIISHVVKFNCRFVHWCLWNNALVFYWNTIFFKSWRVRYSSALDRH